MAWENKIIGYKIVTFNDAEGSPVIPINAVFLAVTIGKYNTLGRIVDGLPKLECSVYHFKIPVYKKVRTKKK